MLKTCFDYTAAALGLILLSPLFLLLAIAIKLESKGAVFYLQTRVGLRGKEFKIFKFRSMRLNQGLALTIGADARITCVGKIIRKCHLDEFAQLINVLRGEMSLVGPRPENPKYTKFYKQKWKQVLSVKPGITGLSQVELAKVEYAMLAKCQDPEATYIKKILPPKLDTEIRYITTRSFARDIQLILRTVLKF
ncbi:MAG: sugar transferase [Rickettsiales bacterium]